MRGSFQRRGRRLDMVVAAAVCSVVLGGLGVAAAEARLLAFKTPTGSITCVMSTGGAGGYAQCELRSHPHRGGFLLRRRGPVLRYDVGYDDLAGRRFVLRRGQSRRVGRFLCVSRSGGMSCRNRLSRHGFRITRDGQDVY